MGVKPTAERIQEKLDAITRKWWLYPCLLLLFFIRSYASKGYDYAESLDLIGQALSNPLIFTFPALRPVAKVVPVALIAGVMLLGNGMGRVFDAYAALLYLALALFQCTAVTDTYGLIVVSGNLALVLVVAMMWIWEVVVGRNDFAPRKTVLWRWWVAPLALVAFVAPISERTLSPDFRPLELLTNGSGLTFCMMTPLILAVLTLFHPTVNLALLRVSSFVGMVFGAVNLITWFVLQPSGWWMGVLHIPLAAISVYAFVLANLRGEGHARES
jgi:hypothetical protein